MSKADELNLVSKLLSKIKETHSCEKAFAELDHRKVGYLSVACLQSGLPKIFDIHLTREQFLCILKLLDSNDDGVITQAKFYKFYHEIESQLRKAAEGISTTEISLDEIFSSLLTVMKERNLTLMEIFMQLDSNQNGYINIDEFVSLLRTIGYLISEQKAYDLFKKEIPGFDGKISYKTLNLRIKETAKKHGLANTFEDIGKDSFFGWRDKALDSLLKVINSISKNYTEYFNKYDSNHDGVMNPKEFRESIRALKCCTKSQIDRILVLLSAEKDHMPTISITKLTTFLSQYGSNSVRTKENLENEFLVNEELFVMIVQHFDGFTVLNNKTYTLYENINYLDKHYEEIKSRGTKILSNANMIDRIMNGAKGLVLNLRDSLVTIANIAINAIRNEAKQKLLPSVIDSKEEAALKAKLSTTSAASIIDNYRPVEIDPRTINVEKDSKFVLPSGCTCYKGTYGQEKIPIQINVYSTHVLSRISQDGKPYKKHLELELAAQLLMHSTDPKSTFKIIGKYEKKTGIGENSVELYIVFEDIPMGEHISLEDFLHENGGLLEMPLLRNTEAALYISKLWSQDLLKHLSILHENGLVLQTLNPTHLYLHKPSSTIKFAHFRGIGLRDPSGKIMTSPDLNVHSSCSNISQIFEKDLYLAPDHLIMAHNERTTIIDSWSFGCILYTILCGSPPVSYYAMYRNWANSHKIVPMDPLKLPLIQPSSGTFIYTPVSNISLKENKPEYKNIKEYLTETIKYCGQTVLASSGLSYSVVVKGESNISPFGENVKEVKKTVLGMLFDVISCCLDENPENRPTIRDLSKSKVFQMDAYERTSANKFAKSVFLYKSPSLCVTIRNKIPLRELCLSAIKYPDKLLTDLENPILEIVDRVLENIHTITTPYTEAIRNVLIDSRSGASPHAPIAKQIVDDKIIDMLIFLCHRYTRNWLIQNRSQYKELTGEAEEFARKSTGFINLESSLPKESGIQEKLATTAKVTKKPKYLDYSEIKKEKQRKEAEEKEQLLKTKKNAEALEARKKFEESVSKTKKSIALQMKNKNRVLNAVCNLIHKLIVEMQFRDSVMAPFVTNVLDYLIKLMIGEDYIRRSELLRKSTTKINGFYNSSLLQGDPLDKTWEKSHRNQNMIMHEFFWDYTVYASVQPIFQGIF